MLDSRSWRGNVLVTSNISHQHHILAYYDVGYRLEFHQHTFFCRQHLKWSSSLSHHLNDVTNITVTVVDILWCLTSILKDRGCGRPKYKNRGNQPEQTGQ